MTKLLILASKEVSNTFRWRSHNGRITPVADMSTSHLFNTVRMIWNNVAPPSARVGTVKLYIFGPHYTHDYLVDAIRAMVPELGHRKDLAPYQYAQLEFMEHWFHRDLKQVE